MLKGLLVGIVIGVLLVAAGGYFYFATGRAPVATTAPDMPFERRFARMALHAYLDKLPHPAPAVPADEKNLMDGAKGYKENCAVCHGLPGAAPTAIAGGIAPRAPPPFKGKGVTDEGQRGADWK